MRAILKTYGILLLALFLPVTSASATVSLHCYDEPVQDEGGVYSECDPETGCCMTLWRVDYYRAYNRKHCFIFTTGALGDFPPDKYALVGQMRSNYIGCRTNNRTVGCPFKDSPTVFQGYQCGGLIRYEDSVKVFNFSETSYSNYVNIVNFCGGSPLTEPTGSIGHVVINLDAAGGSCEVTNATPYVHCTGCAQTVGSCDPAQGCTETVACEYERLKLLSGLHVLEPSEPDCSLSTDCPVNLATGEMLTVSQEDFSLGEFGRVPKIGFTRHYRSRYNYDKPFSKGWTHSLNWFLEGATPASTGIALIKLVDWRGWHTYFYRTSDGTIVSLGDKRYSLSENADGTFSFNNGRGTTYTFQSEQYTQKFLIGVNYTGGHSLSLGYTETAPITLASVNDNLGRTISIESSNGKILKAILPGGEEIQYNYTAGNLTEVVYPDGSTIGYGYNDPQVNTRLTEVRDDNNNIVEKHVYDTQGRVIESYNSGETNMITIDYVANNKTSVISASGLTTTYTFKYMGSKAVPLKVAGPGCAACPSALASYTWDDITWNKSIETDHNGNITKYEDYDDWGNPGRIIEAFDTSEKRTTYYTYHPFLNTPLTVTKTSVLGVDNKVTTSDYDDDGDDEPNENPTGNLYRLIEEGFIRDAGGNSVPYQYITTYTYNSAGQVLAVDGPRGDINDSTTFTYYPNEPGEGNNRGQLQTMADALGHITTYSDYDAYGNAGKITDPNGNDTDFSYDARNRVKTIKQVGAGPDGADITTEYFYDGAGNLDYILLPKGNVVDYNYDAANRLSSITRRVGSGDSSEAIDSITYEYDTESNRTKEEYWDGEGGIGILTRKTEMAYDNYNRLWKVFNPETGSFSEYLYDPNGNRTDLYDDNGNWTEYLPDALNRLIKVTQHYVSGDGLTTDEFVTNYQYDSQGNLTQVMAANGLTTAYQYDDMGRLVEMNSPDTGLTRYWYDGAGNLVGKLDANGNTTTYTYDALNRLTNIDFEDPEQNIVYYYDGNNPHGIPVSNGIGRLTGMSDVSGGTTWSYDKRGNIVQEVKTVEDTQYSTSYAWDLNGNLQQITYPNGKVVEYVFDSIDLDRVDEIQTTVHGEQLGIAGGIDYEPFGDIRQIEYADGTTIDIERDLRYQITRLAGGPLVDLSYSTDPVGNILSITDNLDPSKDQSFLYDSLNRLVSATSERWGGTYTYSYDAVGNRIKKATPVKTIDYTYSPGTNRLVEIIDPPVPVNGSEWELRKAYYRMLIDLSGMVWKSRGKYLWGVLMNMIGRIDDFLVETGIDSKQFYRYLYKNPETKEIMLTLYRMVFDDMYVQVGWEEKRVLRRLIRKMWRVDITKITDLSYDPVLGYDANGNLVSYYDEEADWLTEMEYDPLNRLREKLNQIEGEMYPQVSYLYDGQGRRVQTNLWGEKAVFLYDIFGNIIFEQREVMTEEGPEVNAVDYIYLGAHRVAMVGIPPLHPVGGGIMGCSTFGAVRGISWGTFLVNVVIYLLPLIWLFSRRLLRRRRYANSGALLISFAILAISILVATRLGWAQNGEEEIEGLYFYHNGHLGQPLKITDESGNIVWQADYEPFGKALFWKPRKITNNFRLPGQYHDRETGFHYNMNRYYWPNTGRYITPDPLLQILDKYNVKGTFPIDLNLYLYVGANPINFIDPTGLKCQSGKCIDCPMGNWLIAGISAGGGVQLWEWGFFGNTSIFMVHCATKTNLDCLVMATCRAENGFGVSLGVTGGGGICTGIECKEDLRSTSISTALAYRTVGTAIGDGCLVGGITAGKGLKVGALEVKCTPFFIKCRGL